MRESNDTSGANTNSWETGHSGNSNRSGATFRPAEIDSYVISADHACAKAENVAKCISPPNLRLVSDIEHAVKAR